MKIYVASRESGDFIEEVESIEEGMEVIKGFENADKRYGCYEPNFYELENEEHEPIE